MKHLLSCLLISIITGGMPIYAYSDGVLQKTDTLISFNVIQDQFAFNYKDIKSAEIIEHNGEYKGLRITLKPYAIETFKRITTAGIGKVAILVINNKIVSSFTIEKPLGGDILVASLTRGEAQDIINTLKQDQSLQLTV